MAASVKNISNRVIIPKACRERFLPLDRPALRPLSDCGVESAGVSELVAPFRIGRAAPNFHVALFTLGGRAGWRTAAASGEIKSGTFWFSPAGAGYEYWAEKNWRVVWFHLKADARAPGELISRDCSSGERLAAVCAGLLFEAQLASPSPIERAYADIVAELLRRELLPDARRAQTAQSRQLDELWSRVADDLQHPWRVEELAAEIHVSIVHFHRLVARTYGTTPLALITQLRMRRASEYLQQTDYKLEYIAQLVGFQTPFSFSRAFKQHTGTSPKTLRQKGRAHL